MTNQDTIQSIQAAFAGLNYIADEELATILFLILNLKKPLLLEGNPGVGKTEVAHVLAQHLGTELIRLQCYEGLDVNTAVYEWNYQKQLLAIKIQEQSQQSAAEKEAYIFGEDFLLKRPLLKAITADRPPVLLIDEVDRADEEFEAYLLELLSAFQISIPEIGTIRASHIPYVILTSNRTRELSDALKRRCLYHWVNYPSPEKELQIVEKHFPGVQQDLAKSIIELVGHFRGMKLDKTPGIAETLDWINSLLALQHNHLSKRAIESTLGCVLKSTADIERIKSEGVAALLEQLNQA